MTELARRRAIRAWLVVAIVCIVVGAIALAIDTRQMTAAFVAAYVAVLSIVLGTMAMTMIADLTTATWFASFRGYALSIIGALPVLAAFAIVLVVAAPWQHVEPPPLGSSRAFYMEGPFVAIRAVVYWVTWLAIGRALRSRRERRLPVVASVGLVALALTMTFASFDWMMSLSPRWYSTIYGVYWFAGGMVGALSLLALIARRASRNVDAGIPRDRWHSLGKLLCTFVLFWAYIGFAQYIVIWSGNLPAEVTWYVPRTHGGWGSIALAIVFGAGAVPFVILLFRRPKRSGGALAAVAALLLVFHYLDSYWLVMPSLASVGATTIVLSVIALGAVVAPAMALAIARSRSTSTTVPFVR